MFVALPLHFTIHVAAFISLDCCPIILFILCTKVINQTTTNENMSLSFPSAAGGSDDDNAAAATSTTPSVICIGKKFMLPNEYFLPRATGKHNAYSLSTLHQVAKLLLELHEKKSNKRKNKLWEEAKEKCPELPSLQIIERGKIAVNEEIESHCMYKEDKDWQEYVAINSLVDRVTRFLDGLKQSGQPMPSSVRTLANEVKKQVFVNISLIEKELFVSAEVFYELTGISPSSSESAVAVRRQQQQQQMLAQQQQQQQPQQQQHQVHYNNCQIIQNQYNAAPPAPAQDGAVNSAMKEAAERIEQGQIEIKEKLGQLEHTVQQGTSETNALIQNAPDETIKKMAPVVKNDVHATVEKAFQTYSRTSTTQTDDTMPAKNLDEVLKTPTQDATKDVPFEDRYVSHTQSPGETKPPADEFEGLAVPNDEILNKKFNDVGEQGFRSEKVKNAWNEAKGEGYTFPQAIVVAAPKENFGTVLTNYLKSTDCTNARERYSKVFTTNDVMAAALITVDESVEYDYSSTQDESDEDDCTTKVEAFDLSYAMALKLTSNYTLGWKKQKDSKECDGEIAVHGYGLAAASVLLSGAIQAVAKLQGVTEFSLENPIKDKPLDLSADPWDIEQLVKNKSIRKMSFQSIRFQDDAAVKLIGAHFVVFRNCEFVSHGDWIQQFHLLSAPNSPPPPMRMEFVDKAPLAFLAGAVKDKSLDFLHLKDLRVSKEDDVKALKDLCAEADEQEFQIFCDDRDPQPNVLVLENILMKVKGKMFELKNVAMEVLGAEAPLASGGQEIETVNSPKQQETEGSSPPSSVAFQTQGVPSAVAELPSVSNEVAFVAHQGPPPPSTPTAETLGTFPRNVSPPSPGKKLSQYGIESVMLVDEGILEYVMVSGQSFRARLARCGTWCAQCARWKKPCPHHKLKGEDSEVDA